MFEAMLKSAIEYGRQNRIEEWVHEYLCGEGDNKGLSDGLKNEKRQYTEPQLMNLDYHPPDGLHQYNASRNRIGKLRLTFDVVGVQTYTVAGSTRFRRVCCLTAKCCGSFSSGSSNI